MTAGSVTADTPAALAQAFGTIAIDTPGEGLHDITRVVAAWLAGKGCRDGLLTLFLRHTSASLTIQENADPDVCTDIVTALRRLAPQDGRWLHATEGPDDMPAHIRAMLTGINLAIPVQSCRMMLGTWQGIYLAEHRTAAHRREVVMHFLGTIGAPHA